MRFRGSFDTCAQDRRVIEREQGPIERCNVDPGGIDRLGPSYRLVWVSDQSQPRHTDHPHTRISIWVAKRGQLLKMRCID